MGNHLRDLRNSKGWTLAELAERVGIPLKTISGYENGNPIPTTRLKVLALVFGVPAQEILRTDDQNVLADAANSYRASNPLTGQQIVTRHLRNALAELSEELKRATVDRETELQSQVHRIVDYMREPQSEAVGHQGLPPSGQPPKVGFHSRGMDGARHYSTMDFGQKKGKI